MLLILSNKKGSTTIEAALLYPIVFILIFIIINTAFFLYFKACFLSVTHTALTDSISYCVNINTDIATGYTSIDNLNNPNMYWRLYILNAKEKEKSIKEYLEELIKHSNLYRYSKPDIEVKIVSLFLNKYIKVNIKGTYNFMGFKRKYNMTESMLVEVKGPLLQNKNIIDKTEFGDLYEK